MRLFEVLGPVMIGPSSSHTAGAVRIGATARKLLGGQPAAAHILLYGSFAATGRGHGTDRALVAGLLGMHPDDGRIPQSLRLAQEQGLAVTFGTAHLRSAHPNTAVLHLRDAEGRALQVQAASVGGGRIRVEAVDGITARFSGETNTLIVHNDDEPGHISRVTGALAERGINIATLQVYRSQPGGSAVMVLECDQAIPSALAEQLRGMPGIAKVTRLNMEEE